MAALFALCLLSPVAAFAVSAAPAHCLTVAETPRASEAHSHRYDGGGHADHDAMAHTDMDQGAQASASGDDPAMSGKCCGLFCVSSLTPPVFGVVEMRPVTVTEVALPVTASLLGRTPNGIDRPPRVLSSL